MVLSILGSVGNRLIWLAFYMCSSLYEFVISKFPKLQEKHAIVVLRDMGAVVNEKECELDKLARLNLINIKIKDMKVLRSATQNFTLSVFEDYVNGLWTCDNLEDFLCRILEYSINRTFSIGTFFRIRTHFKLGNISDQSVQKNWETARAHYDFGNEHWQGILGKTMVYSGAYWEGVDNLDDAQIQKMHLIAQKLKLKPGMRVMDLGCGWGSLAKFLAEKYQVEVVGVTNSVEGAAFSRKMCQGLPVEIKVCDYRDIPQLVKEGNGGRKFHRIVSVELIEHIGKKNYRSFFQVLEECLEEDGLILVQVMLRDRKEAFATVDWIQAVVPHAYIPYHRDILRELEGIFSVQDLHNFGPDFYKSSLAWRQNLVDNWPEMVEGNLYKSPTGEKVDTDVIFRTWYLFFSLMASPFRIRHYHLWHLVLTKVNNPLIYHSVR